MGTASSSVTTNSARAATYGCSSRSIGTGAARAVSGVRVREPHAATPSAIETIVMCLNAFGMALLRSLGARAGLSQGHWIDGDYREAVVVTGATYRPPMSNLPAMPAETNPETGGPLRFRASCPETFSRKKVSTLPPTYGPMLTSREARKSAPTCRRAICHPCCVIVGPASGTVQNARYAVPSETHGLTAR